MIYWALLDHGPMTATECFKVLEDDGRLKSHNYNTRTRFNEMRALGIIYERETGFRCSITNRPVILWDLTGRRPEKPYEVREWIIRIAVDRDLDCWQDETVIPQVKSDLGEAIRNTNSHALLGLCLQERIRDARGKEKVRAKRKGFIA
jgi:hypothetical protein